MIGIVKLVSFSPVILAGAVCGTTIDAGSIPESVSATTCNITNLKFGNYVGAIGKTVRIQLHVISDSLSSITMYMEKFADVPDDSDDLILERKIARVPHVPYNFDNSTCILGFSDPVDNTTAAKMGMMIGSAAPTAHDAGSVIDIFSFMVSSLSAALKSQLPTDMEGQVMNADSIWMMGMLKLDYTSDPVDWIQFLETPEDDTDPNFEIPDLFKSILEFNPPIPLNRLQVANSTTKSSSMGNWSHTIGIWVFALFMWC